MNMKMYRALGIMIGAAALASAGASAQDHVVVQKDRSFSVPELAVKKGDTVTFRNEEQLIVHTVYSTGPQNAFKVQNQDPGKSTTVTFGEAGVTEVKCAIHPKMKLKVRVQ